MSESQTLKSVGQRGQNFSRNLQGGIPLEFLGVLIRAETVACQAPLSMELSRQEYWSGLPFPPPGELPDPRVEPASLASRALAGGFFATHSAVPISARVWRQTQSQEKNEPK